MQSNFEFLAGKFPTLAQLGSTAESYLYSDANACLIKLGLFSETIVNQMMQMDHIPALTSDNTHANRTKLLKQEGLLPKDVDDILHALRIARNRAVHENFDSFEDCKTLLEMSHNLGVWFMQTYGEWSFGRTNIVKRYHHTGVIRLFSTSKQDRLSISV